MFFFKYNKKAFYLFLISIFLLFSFLSSSVLAKEAKLSNIIITNTRDDLLCYLEVEGAFKSKIKEAIMSGVPASFSFFISLYNVRSMWFDKKIVDLTLIQTLKYNNLKKEFLITSSKANHKPIIAKTFEEAIKLISEIENLKIVPLKRLKKGEVYQIRIKAELSKSTLPLYLHYILFFVSLWDFETDWYTINFIY